MSEEFLGKPYILFIAGILFGSLIIGAFMSFNVIHPTIANQVNVGMIDFIIGMMFALVGQINVGHVRLSSSGLDDCTVRAS